jgi:FkbM family methyltransferase
MGAIGWIKRVLGRDPNFLPREAYAQDGEDVILERLLDGQTNGFYVDIGAHHPMRFSNTYLFYRKGWHGINIDAQPGSMAPFRRHRQRDTNLESGVGTLPGSFPYFRFDEPALNTFDPAEAKRKDAPPYHLLEVVEVAVRRLDDILNEHLPTGEEITFLTVDVEGRDLDVLQSNDWTRFRPRFVLAETLRADLLSIQEGDVSKFLAGVGYVPIAKAYNTTFFERRKNRR